MNPKHRLELDRLMAQSKDGRLHPKVVVDEARPKRSPLHDWFEWDQKKGHEMNLLNQARDLISSYLVTVRIHGGGPPVRTRQFVSLTTDRVSGGGYRAIAAVLSDEEMTRQLLADALTELESFSAKYRKLEQLAGVMGEIDKVLERHQPTTTRRRRQPGRPSAAA